MFKSAGRLFLHPLNLFVGQFTFFHDKDPGIVAWRNQDKCYEKIGPENGFLCIVPFSPIELLCF